MKETLPGVAPHVFEGDIMSPDFDWQSIEAQFTDEQEFIWLMERFERLDAQDDISDAIGVVAVGETTEAAQEEYEDYERSQLRQAYERDLGGAAIAIAADLEAWDQEHEVYERQQQARLGQALISRTVALRA